jgi:hypothetical protein
MIPERQVSQAKNSILVKSTNKFLDIFKRLKDRINLKKYFKIVQKSMKSFPRKIWGKPNRKKCAFKAFRGSNLADFFHAFLFGFYLILLIFSDCFPPGDDILGGYPSFGSDELEMHELLLLQQYQQQQQSQSTPPNRHHRTNSLQALDRLSTKIACTKESIRREQTAW